MEHTGLIERYLATVRALPELAPGDARSLAWRSWSGDRAARQALIERHLWLAVEQAVRLAPHDAVRQSRLIAAGNRALVDAAASYRPWDGAEFVSFARAALLADTEKEVLPES
jgi:DNA-directed RNA polymerase sigma subunit (sigma70/sigma32)